MIRGVLRTASRQLLLARALSAMQPQMTKWNLSGDEIRKGTEKLMEEVRGRYDRIAALSPTEIESCLGLLKETHRIYDSTVAYYEFPSQVSADENIREAAVEAEKLLSKFSVEMNSRKDVFDVVCSYGEKIQPPTPESKRLIERVIRDGRRVGLHLDKEKQEQIKDINTRISELQIQFQKNMNDDKTCLYYTGEELKGVSGEFIKGLEQNKEGKYKVTLQYPDLYPVLKQCTVEETRRSLLTTRYSMCRDANTPLLEELVKLRHEKAQLLGYETHADFILDARMAKSKETVKNFLEDMVAKMKTPLQKEFDGFAKLKESECKESGQAFSGTVETWDIYHYMQLTQKQKYSVDNEMLKEYFPMDKVTEGLLKIYQDIFNLKFTEVKEQSSWHKDAQLFSVFDKSSEEFLGQFYIDLYPREGKYGHAAVFGLQPGCLLPDGKRQPAVCALVCNFTAATKDKPSLLYHNEVLTYFHEFGHAMHQILAQAECAYFSGTNVERDFVEAPSQMLENWCWEKESLKLMSGHYKDGSAIPDNLMSSLVASKLANVATSTSRQLIFGLFDQDIHTRSSADTAQCYDGASRRAMGLTAPADSNFAAQFGHMAGGYDGQYYGYMWSEVYSEDMFQSVFKQTGVLSPDAGMKYRRCILQPGGSLDAFDMLRNMLGRDPNSNAFFKAKGLS